MWLCYLICAIIGGWLGLYLILELHYFGRMFFCLILARFFKKRQNVMDEITVKGVCILNDIDTFLNHMNNARFMRELDFARVDFYERTGLYKCIKKHGGTVAMAASTIRYRRFIKLFSKYTISSKIVYWDDKHIYMEHRFITQKDSFINAIVICKTRLINCSPDVVMNELLQVTPENIEAGVKTKPPLPLEIEKWIESNEISSANLKNAS